MRGHVRRRGKGWAFVVDVPNSRSQRCTQCHARWWIDGLPEDTCGCGGALTEPVADRRQMWRSGFRTRKEAEKTLREFQNDVETGRDPFPSDTTVAEWAGQWLGSTTVRRLTDSTRRRYEQIVRDFILRDLGTMRVADVRPRHLKKLRQDLSEEMSPSSVNQVRAVLSGMMRAAEAADLIESNPVKDMGRETVRRPDLVTPTGDDLVRLIEAAEATPWAVPIVLAATTGLRRGEVLGLQWADIDLDAEGSGRLRVNKAMQRVRGADARRTLERVDLKTDRARRHIVLSEVAHERLRAAKKEQNERRLRLGPAWHDLDLVCDRGDGAPLDPDAFSKATKRLAVSVGIDKRVRLHDLRHAMATLMLEQNVHPAIASAVLGHSSVAFTMDTYQHVTDGMTGEAAAAIDAALASGRVE